MSSVDLAELYHSANIDLSADDFSLRQTGFSACKDLSNEQLVDCCRMFFGWWDKAAEFKWFLDVFKNDDSRFSFIGNSRESSVLAGGLLLSALKGGDPFAGLVVLSASLSGNRLPVVPGIELSTFETEFKNLAVEEKQIRDYNTSFRALEKTAVTKEKMSEGNSLDSMATVVQTAFNETHKASNAAFNELQSVISTMAKDLRAAREQVGMLWWVTGGWSRKLNRSFAEIAAPLANVSAGFDLADLSFDFHGPYAAHAMLSRVLALVTNSHTPIALAEVGDAPSAEEVHLLKISKESEKYPEICPLSMALLKSAEIGKGTSWHAVFERVALAAPNTTLQPLDIAAQAMYERLLLSAL